MFLPCFQPSLRNADCCARVLEHLLVFCCIIQNGHLGSCVWLSLLKQGSQKNFKCPNDFILRRSKRLKPWYQLEVKLVTQEETSHSSDNLPQNLSGKSGSQILVRLALLSVMSIKNTSCPLLKLELHVTTCKVDL